MYFYLDVVSWNHPEATSSDIHRVLGSFLKMAPHRHGGAGSGAHLERMDSSTEPPEVSSREASDHSDVEPDDNESNL